MANGQQRRLVFLEKFIAEYYPSQPAAIRAFVFLLFAFVFVYGTIRLIDGSYVLTTSVGERIPTDELGELRLPADHDGVVVRPVPRVEIDFNGRLIAANSQGQLRIDLDTTEFLGLTTGGALEVKIKQGTASLGHEIGYNRLAFNLDR